MKWHDFISGLDDWMEDLLQKRKNLVNSPEKFREKYNIETQLGTIRSTITRLMQSLTSPSDIHVHKKLDKLWTKYYDALTRVQEREGDA